MFYIYIRGRAMQSELFWTGTNWSGIRQFGKLYDFHEALKIMEHRFHRKIPKPIIMKKVYFDERKKKKRKGGKND